MDKHRLHPLPGPQPARDVNYTFLRSGLTRLACKPTADLPSPGPYSQELCLHADIHQLESKHTPRHTLPQGRFIRNRALVFIAALSKHFRDCSFIVSTFGQRASPMALTHPGTEQDREERKRGKAAYLVAPSESAPLGSSTRLPPATTGSTLPSSL